MFYVCQIKQAECIVRNVFVGKDAADAKCSELQAKWVKATFSVFNEAGMDKVELPVKC
jgi:hypothetical protein